VETSQRSDTLVGAVLDERYRVDGMIATGGMSTVYRGLDLRLDRPVALKVMDARYSGDQQFLVRFQREARAVARLKGPGVVAVYDQGYGGPGGRPAYLVMELIEGGTLRELLDERGPMPPHAVAAVLAPVLGGLAVAHAAGLVHRDIKPENVLISDDGDVKIADFGLVRAVAEAKITSTSVILGTAAYLSPEQVSTGDASPRTDVYAVGILTYELLTGTTPFHGDSALAVAYQRMDHDVPAPSSAIAGVPTQFDEFVAAATARDQANRPADAAELLAELDAIREELALPAFRVPAPRNSAQHHAAEVFASKGVEERTTAVTTDRAPAPAPILPTRNPQPQPPLKQTRAFTREQSPHEGDSAPGQSDHFAGIEISEFEWARQRSKRVLLVWVLTILILTGLVAAGAWTLGSNLSGLI
jgi:serine/threonine protein kinase, bacterial